MIFDAREFEHFVDERSLRKGLRIFEKGMPDLEKSSALEYHFHIGSSDIYIRKKGEKILSYSCTCGKRRSCEHLGAAMFYFQQHALGLTKTPAGKRPLARPPQKPAVKESGANREKKLYDVCSAAICELMKPFLADGRLDSRGISELHSRLNAFLTHAVPSREDQLCVWLAAYAETAPLFNLRFSGDETPLREWYALLESKLSRQFKTKLNAAGRRSWAMATLRSLRNDKCLESRAFEFLLPRFLSDKPSMVDLDLLTQLLAKRKLKTSYLRRINHLLIGEIQIYSKTSGNTALPFRYRKMPAESALALSTVEICAGKEDKAFARLESAIEAVKINQPEAYQEYLYTVISLASRYNKRDLEARLRKICLLQAMFIRQDELDLYLKLFPLNKRQALIEQLISDLKQPNAVNTFDKIAALLLASNRLDELMREMSAHDLRFSLLNEVAIKKLDSCDEKFLKSYTTQLTRVLTASQNLQHQMRLFDQARDFLQKLPPHLSDKAASLLTGTFPQNSRIGEHIRAFFRFSRIHLN